MEKTLGKYEVWSDYFQEFLSVNDFLHKLRTSIVGDKAFTPLAGQLDPQELNEVFRSLTRGE